MPERALRIACRSSGRRSSARRAARPDRVVAVAHRSAASMRSSTVVRPALASPRGRRGRRRRSRRGSRGRRRAGPSDRLGWTSLVSASTRYAWIRSPSRRNSVLASEQSPQKTPPRWRSTSSNAIASSRRSRYGPAPAAAASGAAGTAANGAGTRSPGSALPRTGASASRPARTAGNPTPLEMAQHVVLASAATVDRQLLERVHQPAARRGTGRDGATARRELAESSRSASQVRSGRSHGQVEQAGGLVAQAEPGKRAHRTMPAAAPGVTPGCRRAAQTRLRR